MAIPALSVERATVVVDGAMVYAKPDFDSPVVSYLRKGLKVVVGSKTEGAFRKIAVRKGLIGYISEVDIQSQGKKPASVDPVKPEGKKKKDGGKKAKPKHRRQKPVADTRYVGLLLGYINYREEYSTAQPASNEPTYGLKITGPNLIISGPYLLDFNLAFHLGAPKHYSPGADVPPSGFFAVTDLSLLFPFSDSQNSMAYVGLGPHLNFSHFNVIYQKTQYLLEELRAGVVGTLGGGVRLGGTILRTEFKYYWDRERYAAIQIGLQTEF